MPDEKTIQPHAEAVEKATHEPETAGNPEHANPQPMMANAPRHKAEHELPPSDEHPAADDGAEEVHADAEHQEVDHQESEGDEPSQADEETHDDAAGGDDEKKEEDAAPEPPPAVPGTPGNTGTVLHSPPVTPAKAPDPDTIMPSKTASSNPKEGVPILDSNHTLSHIPPRDTSY